MDKIVNIEEYARNRKFNLQVLNFFHALEFPFRHFLEEQEALVVLKTHSYLFVFLTFVKKGDHTSFPVVSDRFQDIKRRPRVSTGEWVVDHIYELDQKQAKKFIAKMTSYVGDKNRILELKNRIRK